MKNSLGGEDLLIESSSGASSVFVLWLANGIYNAKQKLTFADRPVMKVQEVELR